MRSCKNTKGEGGPSILRPSVVNPEPPPPNFFTGHVPLLKLAAKIQTPLNMGHKIMTPRKASKNQGLLHDPQYMKRRLCPLHKNSGIPPSPLKILKTAWSSPP